MGGQLDGQPAAGGTKNWVFLSVKPPKFSRLRRAKGQPLFAVDYDSFPLNYTRFGAPDPLPPHHGGAAERLNEGTAPP